MVVYVFWDASGLGKRYTPEKGSDVVDAIFDLVPIKRMMCLLLTVGEVCWMLVRKRNDGRIDQTTYKQAMDNLRTEILDNPDFAKLPVDEDLLVRSLDMIERYAVNSVDALILCAALVANELLSEGESLLFVAADERLLRAAQSEGLAVLNPEHVTVDEARMQITAL